MRPTLAVWKFASCDGCQLTLLDCEDELLTLAGEVQIAHFLEATSTLLPGPYDVSLVEGSVTTPADVERIQRVRAQSKVLVTIGACATAGGIQALRNFGDVDEFRSVVYASPQYIDTLATSTPISEHVHVDFALRGCPIDKGQLVEVISAFLVGRKPDVPDTSVCIECKRRGLTCVMVADGTPCLGPVTHAGCGAICPSVRRGCYGCFGPMSGANLPALIGELHRCGMSDGAVDRVFATFNVAAPQFRDREALMATRSRRLQVSSLARVEGEGALRIIIDDGQVTSSELQIYEPPRFFEAFLRGRQHTEVADITSRICGICPVAYQTSAWQAIEDVCGVVVDERILALRRLLYCGEWISSHVLHIYLLHAPDFLGYADVISLAGDHRDVVERGLSLKKAGNAILERIGGRAIHPVNTRVGGFYSAPTVAELAPLAEQLRHALDAALATVAWTASLDFPDLDLEHEMLAVRHPSCYAIESGELVTSTGSTFPASDFGKHVVEHQVPYSTALHAMLDGRTYLTGPLARYSLNSAMLSPVAREAAADAGLAATCRNPFRSIVVRAVEVVYAVDEALRIIADYDRPEPAAVDVPPRAGVGHGVSEAPRGLLYHRYELDTDGLIRSATIVPPTSQNQPAIEDDLRRVVSANLRLDDGALTALCEQTIRNYDPCISCATHFLELTIERR